MFDGIKVRKKRFKEGQSLQDGKEELIELIRNINMIDPFVKNTQLHERQNVFDLLSENSRNVKMVCLDD